MQLSESGQFDVFISYNGLCSSALPEQALGKQNTGGPKLPPAAPGVAGFSCAETVPGR